MPHVVSKSRFARSRTVVNNFEIMDYLTSDEGRVSLLPVMHEGNMFFVEEVKREHDFLYKIDKLTKPKDLSKTKEILSFIADNTDTVYHNINGRHKHSRFDGKYLKEARDIEDIEADFVEIGFGSGRHMLEMARNNPQRVIVGFETYDPSIRQVLNAISMFGLSNVYICKSDARVAINVLKPMSISKIFLHFPVPWNRAKHRRVFSKEFLENASSVLRHDGILNIKSDDYTFVQDCIRTCLESREIKLKILKNENSNGTVSKYEEKWRNQKKDIYELNIHKRNTNGVCLAMRREFPKTGSIKHVERRKYVGENYFISTKDLFHGNLRGEYHEILQVSFGGTSMPFSTYLVLCRGSIRYMNNPVETDVYTKAHDTLCDIIANTVRKLR